MTVERSSLVRPAVLQKGDTVGIVAPAGPVNRQQFEAGVLALRQLGLVAVFSESIFDRELYFAGGVQRRVDELHEMFRLPEVKAIICARGGYGSNYLLPHLNLGLIAKNPKIFCGYSDVTTLLTHFHDRLGLVGFHGPMLAKDFARPDGVHLKTKGYVHMWEKAAAAAQEMLKIEPQFTLSSYRANVRVLANSPWGARLLDALRRAGFPE